MNTILVVCFYCLTLLVPGHHADLKFYQEKDYHAPASLSNGQLKRIALHYNETYLKDVLQQIMVPRVVGTPSHENVKTFIGNTLTNLGWSVETDDFLANTPNLGQLKFSNVVARLNPSANRYLCLACHYDSKYFPGQNFVGAIDSAVPCAMLLEIAHSLKNQLDFASKSKLSLMFIFFDGEEAFLEWSANDSIYGARNLATKWARSPYPRPNAQTTELDRMDLMVLLDLIGAHSPVFYSYFRETSRWHSLLVNIERRLKANNAISSSLPTHFVEKSTYSNIEDDHLPFLEQSVPILHVIPNPFPKVWHTIKDDYSALDFPTIRSVTTVIQAFVMSYLKT